MFGTGKESGLIQFSLETIFAVMQATPNREYLIRVSFYEILNESITDHAHCAQLHIPTREVTKSPNLT